MTEEKLQEILEYAESVKEEFSNASDLARHIEHVYIFGPVSTNEHYKIEALYNICVPLYIVEETI